MWVSACCIRNRERGRHTQQPSHHHSGRRGGEQGCLLAHKLASGQQPVPHITAPSCLRPTPTPAVPSTMLDTQPAGVLCSLCHLCVRSLLGCCVSCASHDRTHALHTLPTSLRLPLTTHSARVIHTRITNTQTQGVANGINVCYVGTASTSECLNALEEAHPGVKAAGVTCVKASSDDDCLAMIKKGDADLTVVGGEWAVQFSFLCVLCVCLSVPSV